MKIMEVNFGLLKLVSMMLRNDEQQSPQILKILSNLSMFLSLFAAGLYLIGCGKLLCDSGISC